MSIYIHTYTYTQVSHIQEQEGGDGHTDPETEKVSNIQQSDATETQVQNTELLIANLYLLMITLA